MQVVIPDAAQQRGRDGDREDRPEREGVLRLGLDPDAVGALDVPTDDGPHQADDEEDPGGVTHDLVGDAANPTRLFTSVAGLADSSFWRTRYL